MPYGLQAPPGAPPPAAADVAAPQKLRILLVEDDPGDALLVEDTLTDTRLRHHLTCARSLAEAEEPLTRGPVPDCVILDLHLGDAEGLPVLRKVLEWAPGTVVVVLTGLSESQVGTAAVAAGAQDYLVKAQPAPDGLGRAIRYAVQRRQAQRAVTDLHAERMRAQENARLEQGLLPRPRVASERLRVATQYSPGRARALLGGDFYDVVETSDGQVHVVVGDVAGHGAASAAVGVSLRVAWRSLILAGIGGPRLVELLEELLVAEHGGAEMFVTLITLTLPPDEPVVRVVRAGHHGFLLHTPGGVVLAESPGGLAIGMVPGAGGWRQHDVPLPPGSALVLFTDGLFEGRIDDTGRRLGLDGLVRLAGRHRHRGPEDFLGAVIADVEAASAGHGGLVDDLAVVHVGWIA